MATVINNLQDQATKAPLDWAQEAETHFRLNTEVLGDSTSQGSARNGGNQQGNIFERDKPDLSDVELNWVSDMKDGIDAFPSESNGNSLFQYEAMPPITRNVQSEYRPSTLRERTKKVLNYCVTGELPDPLRHGSIYGPTLPSLEERVSRDSALPNETIPSNRTNRPRREGIFSRFYNGIRSFARSSRQIKPSDKALDIFEAANNSEPQSRRHKILNIDGACDVPDSAPPKASYLGELVAQCGNSAAGHARLAKNSSIKFGKKLAKGFAYLTPIATLMKKEGVVTKTVCAVDDLVGDTRRISGEDLHEVMYKNGVNNTFTFNAIEKELCARGITVDGPIKSKYARDDIVLVNFANKWLGLGKIGDGLQIYKGENFRDTLERNLRISGETKAMMQSAAVACYGIPQLMHSGATSGFQKLEDYVNERLEGTRLEGYGKMAPIASLMLLSAAINSGQMENVGRSAANLYSKVSDPISKRLSNRANNYERQGKSRLAKYFRRGANWTRNLGYAAVAGGIATTLAGSAYGTAASHEEQAGDLTQNQPIQEINHQNNFVPLQDTITPSPPLEIRVEENINASAPTKAQIADMEKNGFKYDSSNGEVTYQVTEKDKGLGFSQILTNADKAMGEDKVITPTESARYAHEVAANSSGVRNVPGEFSFSSMKDPNNYQIRLGSVLRSSWSSFKSKIFG